MLNRQSLALLVPDMYGTKQAAGSEDALFEVRPEARQPAPRAVVPVRLERCLAPRLFKTLLTQLRDQQQLLCQAGRLTESPKGWMLDRCRSAAGAAGARGQFDG